MNFIFKLKKSFQDYQKKKPPKDESKEKKLRKELETMIQKMMNILVLLKMI